MPTITTRLFVIATSIKHKICGKMNCAESSNSKAFELPLPLLARKAHNRVEISLSASGIRRRSERQQKRLATDPEDQTSPFSANSSKASKIFIFVSLIFFRA
jgi:hypothetical protein